MYNGIGVKTVRGTSTNGYVRKNYAALDTKKLSILKEKKRKYDRDNPVNKRQLEKLNKEPNKQILEHNERRKVEVKIMELKLELEEQGYSKEEIKKKVKDIRDKIKKREEGEKEGKFSKVKREKGKRKYDTHEQAKRKREKNERVRKAFRLSLLPVEKRSNSPKE
eukprot:augustus_masked-scaffold_18-processed-gene-6.11-mRNA-1 protein AED:0.15 eAED:0.21 QI:0/-1/0/1/-1/1/1/0/164